MKKIDINKALHSLGYTLRVEYFRYMETTSFQPFPVLAGGKRKTITQPITIITSKAVSKQEQNKLSKQGWKLHKKGGAVEITIRQGQDHKGRGYSGCDLSDEFSKEQGLNMALGRAIVNAGIKGLVKSYLAGLALESQA